MTVSSCGVSLVGAKIGKVQCMRNGLIVFGPVVDTGCSVVGTWMALVGGTGWGGGLHEALRYAPA